MCIFTVFVWLLSQTKTHVENTAICDVLTINTSASAGNNVATINKAPVYSKHGAKEVCVCVCPSDIIEQ